MEILLIACMLAYVAGAQSEQSKLGVSPAQRDQMREQTRHQKAVQKIADKHGGSSAPSGGGGWWGGDSSGAVDDSPREGRRHGDRAETGTFGSGYRNRRPSRPPFGRRAGERAGQGMTWAQDTGRDAWRAYRERRKREGRNGPELMTAPYPPTYPPFVPPQPVAGPTVVGAPAKPNAPPPVDATDADKKTPAKPAETDANKPAEPVTEADRQDPAKTTPDANDKTPIAETDDKTATDPATETPKTALTKPTEPSADDKPAVEPSGPQPADTPQGVGRMASEVTYESVADESDELSLMCEDDVHVYDRLRERAEREIGRGDDLIAKMQDAGFGDKVIGWVARCKEQYQVIHGQLDELQTNTVAQGEQVLKAKELLEAGQGLYAGIAQDMESVADRDAYISDAVDAEDSNAETEIYETKAAA